jgi:glycosyltransferase involved in cell wall biosynthesis
MIRVANVLTAGRFGGPQNRVLQVAAGLRHRDIHTTVVLPEAGSDEFHARLQEAGVPAVRLPLHRLTRHRSHLIGWGAFFVPELWALVRVLRERQIDLVHCNGVWQVKPVLAGSLVRAKVALHLNDTFTTWPIRALFRVTAPFADAFIFAAHRSRDTYFPAEGANELFSEVIPAPVDVHRFDPRQAQPAPAISEGRWVKVLTAGGVSPIKGLEYFIEMASTLLRRRSDISFHVVGHHLESQVRYTAMLRERAERLPSGGCVFHGPSPDMPSVYRAADIYVCSSVSEASPMAVWEAMAMERPVVSTDVGDVARYIEDGRNGFVVPVRDPAALAAKVESLVRDATLRQRLGQRARETAIAELDISHCVRRHERFYRAIMSR